MSQLSPFTFQVSGFIPPARPCPKSVTNVSSFGVDKGRVFCQDGFRSMKSTRSIVRRKDLRLGRSSRKSLPMRVEQHKK